MVFPLETWQNVMFGRWRTHDDILRLEDRALVVGICRTCRAQHARGKIATSLCATTLF